MSRKIVTISEDNFKKTIKESIEMIPNEEPMLELNCDNVSYGRNIINEIARLNKQDDSQSPFPRNKYKIWVQGDNSPHKPPHMHIYFPQDEWEIKVEINNGQLCQVVSYGNRGRKDRFLDIIKKVQDWFQMETRMPGRIGTNQETALYEWDACNDD